MKSDSESSTVAVKEALAKLHGGKVIFDVPPKGKPSPMEELRKQEKDGLMVDSDSSSEEETCQEINRLPKTM